MTRFLINNSVLNLFMWNPYQPYYIQRIRYYQFHEINITFMSFKVYINSLLIPDMKYNFRFVVDSQTY